MLSTQAKNIVGNGEPDTTREGRAVLDVSGVQGSFGLGAMLEAVPGQLWLGASYQAQPGLGEMKLTGKVRTYYEDGRTEFPVTFHQALPDVIRLGLRWRPERVFELRLHGDRTRWSAMQTQCVSLQGEPCAVYPNGADATAEATTVQNVRRRWQRHLGPAPGRQRLPVAGDGAVRRRRLRDPGHARRDAGAGADRRGQRQRRRGRALRGGQRLRRAGHA